MGVYVVDTTFFAQAHHMDYPLGVKTFFWQRIQQLAVEGTIVSLDKVWADIRTHDNELKVWCGNNLPKNFFKNSASARLMKHYKKIVDWAISQGEAYLPGALEEFLSAREATAWLVAYSIQNGCTVTTYESSRPEQRNLITIPEVCAAFKVPCVNTAKMFYQLGLAF